ncbi:MAG TPA: PAS domain-containing sensor histidine kinase [Acidimicrobiales bacterium]|nr:PAS domain-containing sensor histidine kinase [Acidimicrobiales bacterium]
MEPGHAARPPARDGMQSESEPARDDLEPPSARDPADAAGSPQLSDRADGAEGDDGDDVSAPERELTAGERLVVTLLDSAPDIVTVFNADGSWRYSNAAAARLLGALPDFDPATGVLGLLHADDVPVALEMLRRIQTGELPAGESFEVRILGQNGEWRYLECTGENLIDDPVVQGIVVRSEDVTDRREARARLLEANERLSTLVGSLHIAALVEDTDRAIVLTNEAFVDLFEVPGPPNKLIGRTLADLGPELTRRFGDPTRVPGPDRVARILRERRRVVGDRIAMLDGRVLERDYVPIFVDHEYRGHLWLFRDISAQARNEAEWTQLLATQRDENQRLVELDRVKASFLAEISHELRTPLTSILSFTELLRDGVGRDEPGEQVEFLDVITRNADRLLRLVDDLILLDRAETGILPFEWGTFDVPSLVEAAVTTFSRQAQSKQISLESNLGEGVLIAGDAQRIAQLLDILLSNAIKFTPEGGRVSVNATPSEDHWFISVADTGIGVPQAERESLFERFYRASNARAARIPGSGLGLSVARAIAELHGGEISISSGDSGGAVVLVSLPVGFPRDAQLEMAEPQQEVEPELELDLELVESAAVLELDLELAAELETVDPSAAPEADADAEAEAGTEADAGAADAEAAPEADADAEAEAGSDA